MSDNPLPTMSKEDVPQESFWICNYCTFAENPITVGRCVACDNYKGIRSERNKTLRATVWDFTLPADRPRERRPAPSRATAGRTVVTRPNLVKERNVAAIIQKNIGTALRAANPAPPPLSVVPQPPTRCQVARKSMKAFHKEEETQPDEEPVTEVETVRSPRTRKIRSKHRRSRSITHRSFSRFTPEASESSASCSRSRLRRNADVYAMVSEDDTTQYWPGTKFPTVLPKKKKKRSTIVSFDSNLHTVSIPQVRNTYGYTNEDSMESTEIPEPTNVFSVNRLHKQVREDFSLKSITWTSVSPVSPQKRSKRRTRRVVELEEDGINSPAEVRASTPRSRNRELDPAVQVMKIATDQHWRILTQREQRSGTVSPTKGRRDGHSGSSRGLQDSISPLKARSDRSPCRPFSFDQKRVYAEETDEDGSLRQKRHNKGILKYSGVSFDDPSKKSKYSPSVPAFPRSVVGSFSGYSGLTRSPRLAAREAFKLVRQEPLENSVESSSQEWSDDLYQPNRERKRRINISLEKRESGKILKDGNAIYRTKKDPHVRKRKARPLISVAEKRKKRRENVVPVGAEVEEPAPINSGKRTVTASLLPKPDEKIYKFERFVVPHGEVELAFEEMIFSDYGFSSDEE
ncbi:hypothetical protein RvY_07348 [Ramazzottius varieornatus]|uniref:Uncharacterized protein n=1 Tax=Ramazzottius varieornatus TaxID=947166 RepID=A0A1D1V6T6_RAMVA|nr:hypothetical protein RvY_07348 [Ramazzottius varieornatus]